MKKELAYRDNHGVAVSLDWHSGTNRLSVSVVDRRVGESFELDVEAHEALEVYEHPYAYAAFRGPVYAQQHAA